MGGVPTQERIGLLLLILVVLSIYYAGGGGLTAPSLDGKVAVPTKAKLVLLQTAHEATASTAISNNLDPAHTLHLYRRPFGGLEADPGDLKATLPDGRPVWQVTDTQYEALVSTDWSIGAWTGVVHWTSPGPAPVQTGLLYSPVRLLYGDLEPDVLVSSQAIGVGLSGYLPASVVGETFSHVGLGVARLYAFHHLDQGTMAYLTLSIGY